MDKNFTSDARVLVIGNNCFSDSGSNGKVLQELFIEWDKKCVAQFYIYNEMPNDNVCANYYRVTDSEAAKSFLSGKHVGQYITAPEEELQENEQPDLYMNGKNKIHRNPLTCLLREVVWKSGRWESKQFWNWVEEFSPELILLQVGDSAFLYDLTVKISNKYHIPIALYCTENYYFKKHNYFVGENFGFLYAAFRRQLVKSFRKLIKASSCEIYNSEYLEELYRKEFNRNGNVIYQATSLKSFPIESGNSVYRFTYAGNLGLGRHDSLIKIANTLQEISKEYYLDVYGSASDEVVEEFRLCKGIRYHGRVPYGDVLMAMRQSDFLFHTESFDDVVVKDLETAFSTKIADSLASGRCFILYAHESLACTKYLQKYQCALVITEHDDLKMMLQTLIENPEQSKKYVERALIVAEENHNAYKNSIKFKTLLNEIAEEQKSQDH